jgi:GT2 family glycosyltransferase
MDVSIILVNYRTSVLTHQAIMSIVKMSFGFSYEIIVVDNSSDKTEFNKLTNLQLNNLVFVDAKENLGFGKANNLGASFAKGKYLFFLNTDTLLLNNAIFELFIFMEKNSNAGICGSNLFTLGGKPNHSFFPVEKNIKNDVRFQNIFHSIKRHCFHKIDGFNYSKRPKEIFGYICGAALMIHKIDFERLHGFDKDIFMYAEDSLLCFRTMKELGLHLYNVPTSKIVHFEGGSSLKSSQEHVRMIVDGNFIYYLKAFGLQYSKKYIKTETIFYQRKKLFSRIFRRKKYPYFSVYYYAYLHKLNQIRIGAPSIKNNI